jgi:glycosyltransferase involved in cell wall biosynthesis
MRLPDQTEPLSEGAPMKIGLLIAAAEIGGLLRVTELLADQLSEEGHEVTVISITGDTPPDTTPSRRWKFESLNAQRVATSVAQLRSLSRSRFDVLVVSQFYVGVALAFARPRRSKTAVVWVEHSSLNLWRESGRTKDRMAERLARIACNRVEIMAAVSKETTEAINREFHRLRWPAVELPNPVLVGTEPCFNDEIPNIHRRSNILFVGRLSPEKRVDLLLEAFSTLRDRIDANLVIIGDGPERERLEGLTFRLGCANRVEFRGFLPDPSSEMYRFATLVLCSDFEGLGIVLIEALANGCNVVATDCPAGPREILANGRFGRLVPVGDIAALADAIEKSIDEPAEIDEALRHHLRTYTLSSATTSYEMAIHAAIDRRLSSGR